MSEIVEAILQKIEDISIEMDCSRYRTVREILKSMPTIELEHFSQTVDRLAEKIKADNKD